MITEEEARKLNITKPAMPRMTTMNMMADTTVDTDLIIDLGVIYTPQAKESFGGRYLKLYIYTYILYLYMDIFSPLTCITSDDAIRAAIYHANDNANLYLQNSAVNLRIRIVFITQTFDPNYI